MSEAPTTPRIVAFDSIDSTNAEAHRRAAAGERGPLWIIAARQEAGRGRSGRAWSSPVGNFSATLLMTPEGASPAKYHQLAFVSGLAAWEALTACGANKQVLQLKWPNDLMIDDAKLGGILVESTRFAGDDVIMIGIGINLAVAPEVQDRKVTHLAGHGALIAPETLLAELAPAMTRWLAVWDGGRGFETVRSTWGPRAHPQGQPLSVKGHGREYRGTFEGLGPDGRLEMTTEDGERVSLDHGDVALLQTTGAGEA